MIGDGHRHGGASDLEVVTAAAEVDDVGVVSVFENADEHSLIETLAIAAEDLPRALADGAGAGGIVVIGGERLDGTPDEIECFVPR